MQKQIDWVMLAARVPSSVDWRTCMDQAGGFSFMMASGARAQTRSKLGIKSSGTLDSSGWISNLKDKRPSSFGVSTRSSDFPVVVTGKVALCGTLSSCCLRA